MIVKQIDSFLTPEECKELIALINKNNAKSSVVGADGYSEATDFRTSSTCNLPANEPFVKKISEKIAKEVGRPLEFMESLQGQKYEGGEYFRAHTDWFADGPQYDQHCKIGGNRTETLMIYLNDDFTGGETDFKKLKFKGIPKEGRALYWTNMKDGKGDPDALHEGTDVVKGTKYVITSWWRERSLKEKPKPSNTFSSVETLPKFTEKGFVKLKLPQSDWELVQEMYESVKESISEEKFNGKEDFIPGKGNTSNIMSLESVPHLKLQLHNSLLPLHKSWANTNIEPTFIYGIRSYNKGATLTEHVDRIETHHISSIILVDKDLRCGCKNKEFGDDWALDIQDHNGEWHKVYLEPGEILMYESARCKHGRKDPFQGKYYRNMFIHYKLTDYIYD